jgi:hypothetical protein
VRRLTFSIPGLVLLTMVGLATGCAQGTREEPAPVQSGLIDLGPRLEWSAVDGAIEYRVGVWAQTRLLFEERREQLVLVITPAMERSLLGVETAEMQVRAYAADGQLIGPVQRQEFLAPTE